MRQWMNQMSIFQKCVGVHFNNFTLQLILIQQNLKLVFANVILLLLQLQMSSLPFSSPLGLNQLRISANNLLNYRNLIVFIYPAYMSLMSIKNEDKDSHIQWLTYWVIYGVTCIMESTEFLVRKIPYFSFLRFVFLVLCFLPNVKVLLIIDCEVQLSESIYLFYMKQKTAEVEIIEMYNLQSKKND